MEQTLKQPTFEEIISLENLLLAWKEFVVGKKMRKDVLEFEQHLMKNIISLHQSLVSKNYRHADYEAFKINDPKPRDIHKATVRDRLLHHAIYRILYSFFASIDQHVLIEILTGYISDKYALWLLSEIIHSFWSTREGVGLPLGNLTSQLLVNMYMNEFDQFIKHRVKAKHYIRYADDFVIFSDSHRKLKNLTPHIKDFLLRRLKLQLHPNKVSIATVASGVDFLGWVHFTDHKVLRTVTKKRMFRNLKLKEYDTNTLQSYLGLLRHGNTKRIQGKMWN